MNKINLRITLDNDIPAALTNDTYQYDYKRIAIAVLVLLLISGSLITWVLSGNDSTTNPLEPETLAQKEPAEPLFTGFESEEQLVKKPTTEGVSVEKALVNISSSNVEASEVIKVTSAEKNGIKIQTATNSETDAITSNTKAKHGASTSEKKETIEMRPTAHTTTIADHRTTRAILTWSVNDLEPGELAEQHIQLSKGDAAKKLMFYTELKNMTGQHFFYEWQKNKKPIAKIKVHVGGKRWRSYSSKNLRASMTGDWQVQAIDAEGIILASTSFTVAAD